MCVVLGWIQAVTKEESYIDGIQIWKHKKVQLAIIEFHKKLADGAHVEVLILNDLADLFKINLSNLNENEKSLLGVELEKIVFKYIPTSIKKSANTLEPSQQINMLQEILDHICIVNRQSKIKSTIVEANRVNAINEISREYYWIYRDWQSAIGDEMIEKSQGGKRRFEVIGFGDFQKKYVENEWLKKVDNLFLNLDVSVEDRFDTRVTQLKELFHALMMLIESLKILMKKQETITDSSFKSLKQFDEELQLKIKKNN